MIIAKWLNSVQYRTKTDKKIKTSERLYYMFKCIRRKIISICLNKRQKKIVLFNRTIFEIYESDSTHNILYLTGLRIKLGKKPKIKEIELSEE